MPAANLGETIQNTVSVGPGFMQKLAIIGGVGVVGLILIGLVVWIMWRRNRYNIDVEIKLPRNDGLIIHGEWGKGFYDAKNGVMKIKRKGYRIGEPMPIFDTRRYLQGSRLLTVIQVGPGEYIPVLSRSYEEVSVEYDDESNPMKDENGNILTDERGKTLYHKKHQKEALIDVKADVGKNKAWKTNWTTHAKKAFSIQGFMQQHQVAISIGIVFILCFIGFSILYSKIGA